MNTPKISVIIPIYNAEKFLHQCLDSIQKQTLQEIEIICVDDGSTDNSCQIIEEFSLSDSRFMLVHQTNGGAGKARNTGMKYATGKYYSFLDADDFFEKDMLEKAYNTAEKNNAQIVVFGCDIYENSKGKFEPCNYSIDYSLIPEKQIFAGTDIKKDVFKAFMGWAWDKLFLASYINDNNIIFQEQRTTNDLLFVFSSLVKAERIVVLSDVLAHYRREEGSLSVTREKSWHCFYDALIALKNQLITWNLYERFQQDYINYCVHFSLWNLNTIAEPTYTMLYNKLRDEWFEQMGVNNFAEDYFYNKKEYFQYRRVIQYTVDWKPTKEYIFLMKKLELQEKLSKVIYLIKIHGIIYTINFAMKKVFK